MTWKDKPADPSKKWLNKSLEIQLLLACNWDCCACDQGSQFSGFSWVKRGTLSIPQIEHFCGEMKTANAFFGRLRLVGGEPSLHRNVCQIVEMLHAELVVTGHAAEIEMVSNGSHLEKIAPIRHLMSRVRVSGEKAKQKHHTANLLHTPESLGYEGKMCNAPWHCGISLNYWGYFPCSSGAGVARFEDWMKWQRLTLPTCTRPCGAVRETWPDLQQLCNRCYHALRPEDKVKCGTSDPEKNAPGEHIKPMIDAWKSGLVPDWPVYGVTEHATELPQVPAAV